MKSSVKHKVWPVYADDFYYISIIKISLGFLNILD